MRRVASGQVTPKRNLDSSQTIFFEHQEMSRIFAILSINLGGKASKPTFLSLAHVNNTSQVPAQNVDSRLLQVSELPIFELHVLHQPASSEVSGPMGFTEKNNECCFMCGGHRKLDVLIHIRENKLWRRPRFDQPVDSSTSGFNRGCPTVLVERDSGSLSGETHPD